MRVKQGLCRTVLIETPKSPELALEAKAALGGYFREFTFAKRRSNGWTDCGCKAPFMPGVVLGSHHWAHAAHVHTEF